MGLLNLTLPVIGQSSATEDQKTRDALVAIQTLVNGNLDATNLAAGAVTASRVATWPKAKVTRATAATVPTGAASAVTFDTEAIDSDNIHDNVTNPTRLTARTAGLYIVTGNAGWAVGAGTRRLVYVMLSGSTRIAQDLRAPVSGDETSQSVAAHVQMAVGDYVELFVFQDSGANLTMSTVVPVQFGISWAGP